VTMNGMFVFNEIVEDYISSNVFILIGVDCEIWRKDKVYFNEYSIAVYLQRKHDLT